MAQGSQLLGHKDGPDLTLVHFMNKKVKQDLALPSWSVLSRLDRLDRVMQLLEEKQRFSGQHLAKATKQKVEQQQEQEEDECKTLSNVLEEVQHKGTLMDRLALLENRVLQLSLEMDERNTSKSSSSATVAGPEKIKDHESKIITSPQAKNTETPLAIKVKADQENGRRQSKKASKKWRLRWLQMGC